MISTLVIEGFQSLQQVEIELGKFTVLVGPSNSGKSAIRRALEAIVNNDPVTGRLREGCPAYVVALGVDDTRVAIHKTKKATTYQAGEQLVEKPGASAAPVVLDVLRLSSTNFASQFDPPFLLAETPSAVARALGELTNISVLFEGIREATRRQRAAGQKAKVHHDQVDVLADKLALYADLPAEQDQLQRAHGALQVAADCDGRAKTLEAAWHAARAAEGLQFTAAQELSAQPDWDYVEGTTAAVEATLAELAVWDGALRRAADIERAHAGALTELTSWSKTQLHETYVPSLETQIAEAVRLDVAHRQAGACATTIALSTIELEPNVAERAAEQELASIDVCPLCEQPL